MGREPATAEATAAMATLPVRRPGECTWGIFRDGLLYAVLAGSDDEAASATSEWANDFPVVEWTFRRM